MEPVVGSPSKLLQHQPTAFSLCNVENDRDISPVAVRMSDIDHHVIKERIGVESFVVIQVEEFFGRQNDANELDRHGGKYLHCIVRFFGLSWKRKYGCISSSMWVAIEICPY